MTLDLKIKNQSFILHPSSVAFWKEKEMLLISDVHLGKVSHFRKYGAAVPQNAVKKNFELLTATMRFFKPKEVCFLGDLFHSSLNTEWQLFKEWISTQHANFTLVEGNHDIISPLRYKKIGINVVTELKLNGFLLTHHPEKRAHFFNFCGHIHPAVQLRGFGRQTLRLPCFFKNEQQMIFPAFGTFTGTHIIKPSKNNEVFAITEDAVFKVDL